MYDFHRDKCHLLHAPELRVVAKLEAKPSQLFSTKINENIERWKSAQFGRFYQTHVNAVFSIGSFQVKIFI